jgi:hypothetical protein
MSDEGDAPAEGGMRIEADLVRQLAELLNENELTEIEVVDGDRRIAVKREAAAVAAAPAPVAGSPASRRRPGGPVAEASPASHPGAVKSPMVGTVYLFRRARLEAVRLGRRQRPRGRDPAHRRGDEGDEPDRRAALRNGPPGAGRSTASRSSSTSRS